MAPKDSQALGHFPSGGATTITITPRAHLEGSV